MSSSHKQSWTVSIVGGSNNGLLVENLNCYAGSASGIIYYLNDNGSCMEVLQADGAVKYVLHYAEKVCTVIHNE